MGLPHSSDPLQFVHSITFQNGFRFRRRRLLPFRKFMSIFPLTLMLGRHPLPELRRLQVHQGYQKLSLMRIKKRVNRLLPPSRLKTIPVIGSSDDMYCTGFLLQKINFLVITTEIYTSFCISYRYPQSRNQPRTLSVVTEVNTASQRISYGRDSGPGSISIKTSSL